MKVSIEDVSAVEKKISVTIPHERVKRELERAYRNLQGTVAMRGFRKGKVPRNLLEARFKRQVEGEVSSRLIGDSLDATIEEHSIFMVTRPSIEAGTLGDGDFTYVATVETKPEIDAQGYNGMALERDVYALDDKIIDNQLEQLRRKHGSMEPVEEDRGVREGDVAIINYSLSVDGELLEGPVENFQVELRRDALLPGFTEAVEGMTRGSNRSFDLNAPEALPQPQLAGKTLHFDVTLNEIKSLSLPALDDDLAKDEGFDSLAALRANREDSQRAHLAESAENKLRAEVIAKLIEANPVELPKGLITHNTDQLVNQQAAAYKRQGMGDASKLLANQQRDTLEQQAIRNLKRALILESVAKKENIEATEADVNARIAKLAADSRQRPEAVKGYYMKNNLMDDLREQIILDKALDFVISHAAVTEVQKAYAEHTHGDEGHDHDHDEHDHHDHDHHDHDHHHHDHDHDHDHDH